MVPVEGGNVFFARFGSGPPLLLLHGGLANSDYWGHQVRALLATHTVVVMDTRGHGRSPLIPGRMDYRLFANDVLAVLAALHIDRTAIVGWSDGAITGLELAIRAPERLTALFAFAANCDPSGTIPDGAKTPLFRTFRERAEREYAKLAPHPADWPRLLDALQAMWRTEPRIRSAELAGIKLPVAVADGEHDEIIREQHTRYIARNIPGAKLLLLPDVSHFAMLQQPDRFTAELRSFLGQQS